MRHFSLFGKIFGAKKEEKTVAVEQTKVEKEAVVEDSKQPAVKVPKRRKKGGANYNAKGVDLIEKVKKINRDGEHNMYNRVQKTRLSKKEKDTMIESYLHEDLL